MSKTFLLADDDPDDVALFKEALSIIDPSIIFYFAQDGKAALDKLGDKNLEEPDIIFLDINMPVMNGWECLAKIKLNQSYSYIPVVIYSTASYRKEMEKAFEMGALCFFTKPTDFKDLITNLKAISDNLDQGIPALIGQLKGVRCKES
ncbi:MAG TPA: response regulator [Puia sp.]|jgi:CheY-like chemotaxis protein|nr:response regulator [Puia sp.]